MVGWRHSRWAWLGFLLAGNLVLPGRPAAAMTQHCAKLEMPAPHQIQHAMAPGPTCERSDPCSDCGTLPCRTAAHCMAIPVIAMATSEYRPISEPAASIRTLRLSARIVARSTSPPTPPPIELL